MKNLQKIAIVGFASLLAMSLAGCSQVKSESPMTNPPITSSPTASPLTSVQLPSQFYEFTTTNEVIINDEVVKISGTEKKLILDDVVQADKYVLKFSPDEKWVQLKGDQEILTSKMNVVKNMETTSAFDDAATDSLQQFLSSENYRLDLWWMAPYPDSNYFTDRVNDGTIKNISVKLISPSVEELKAITASVNYTPFDDVLGRVEVKIAPQPNQNLEFEYYYEENDRPRTNEPGKPTKVILKAPQEVTSVEGVPYFGWILERPFV